MINKKWKIAIEYKDEKREQEYIAILPYYRLLEVIRDHGCIIDMARTQIKGPDIDLKVKVEDIH